jgi:ornithine cyclodeaminase
MALLLSRQDIETVLTMEDAIAAVDKSYQHYSAGKTTIPVRTAVEITEKHGVGLFMPGYSPDLGAYGLKIVSVFSDNLSKGLPTISALMVLLDSATGNPLAVMEASWITAVRTGAASGVATGLLACRDAATLAVIGAGVQARTQIEAICAVRPIKAVRIVYHKDCQKALELADRLRKRHAGVTFQVTTDAEGAVRDAAIVVTATTARSPVFAADWVRPGTHINAIGSFKPDMQEIPAGLLRLASKIVVDTREGAIAEAGDFIIPIREGTFGAGDIYAEVGEIASGRLSGRQSLAEITLFKSVGLAALDLAVARLVYDRACRQGVGTEFAFG